MFNEGALISYMRDGILMLTDNSAGTYERVKEWAGKDGSDHEVILKINARVFAGETELVPES